MIDMNMNDMNDNIQSRKSTLILESLEELHN